MKLARIKWGDDSAEKDPNLLEYFVASDAFDRLRSKSKHIVVGRKGSGKSALRKKLEQEFVAASNTFVVNVSPKFNSFRSVLNEKALNQEFGHEIFFQHTWLRHIYLDCLCQIGDSARGAFASDSLEFARRVAVEQNRTSKDLVENIADVLGRIRGKVGSLGELGLQIERELRSIADVDALEHHVVRLTESGARFVILVDDLDLGWDNSRTANNMLLGLLSACGSMVAKSSALFPCVFLREDVYTILLSQTQHADKYRNIERIRWDKDQLLAIVNRRINFNREQNGLSAVANPFGTVFPATIGTSNTDNWMMERTLLRPRELIQLARYYTETVEKDNPDADALKDSELVYSSWKLDDLCSEYSNQYPGLVQVFAYWKANFFRHKYHLRRAEVDAMLENILVEVAISSPWYEEIVTRSDKAALMRVLYEIGFIGDFVLGGEGGSRTFYSYQGRHEPRFEEIQIHPCFRRAVNTVERIRAKSADEMGEGGAS